MAIHFRVSGLKDIIIINKKGNLSIASINNKEMIITVFYNR